MLDAETSRKLITNVGEIQKHRPLSPVEQADLEQARKVVAGDTARKASPSTPPQDVAKSQALIENISKMPPEAAKKSFGAVLKSALKGAAEEIPQEVIDGGFNHIATEMAKGRTFNEAAASYAEQFPQSALTAALLGGTAQASRLHRHPALTEWTLRCRRRALESRGLPWPR